MNATYEEIISKWDVIKKAFLQIRDALLIYSW